METDDILSIPEFYRDSKILITGGSGFMGKVLIEKLLRSCPHLNTIYLLLRSKKGKDPHSRIDDITCQALFDRLRYENPTALLKLKAISGDVMEINLGLSEEDRKMLQNEVTVVFHVAASIRFDDPLRDAVLINVRGTQQVLDLALGMKDLKVFLHLSTAYCNYDKYQIEEKIYDPPANWKSILRLAEDIDNAYLLQILTPKIIGGLPNTYTFAKALGEQVVKDYEDLLPLVIVRPSIVVSTASEPIPGWIDNWNGPVAIWLGIWSGLLRTIYCHPDGCCNYVPVDVAIKSIIFIAWHRAMSSAKAPVNVYNCCSMIKTNKQVESVRISSQFFKKYPLNRLVWYPITPSLIDNETIYFINVILFHMLPACLLDMALKISGKKTMFCKLHRRIYTTSLILHKFCNKRVFNFDNDKFLDLETTAMHSSDAKDFSYNTQITDDYTIYKTTLLGARVHLLRDPLSTLPQAAVKQLRLYWMDRFVKTTILLIFMGFIILFMYSKLCT